MQLLLIKCYHGRQWQKEYSCQNKQKYGMKFKLESLHYGSQGFVLILFTGGV